jgi:queuosine precursor transporter
MELITIFIWIIATLALASFSGILGKKYGVQYMIATAAALMVIVNVMNTKLVSIGSFVVPGGTLLFAVTFLITDIISEKFGKKYAIQAVWAGFYALIIYLVSVWIVLAWTPSSFALEASEAFSTVFSLAPRIILGSLVAYLIGQHHDVWAFHFWKKKTNGKHLWLRNNASTAVSQFIDSIIFVVIAFLGVVPNIWTVILSVYVVKLMIAIVDTPFIYGISYLMDKIKTRS